MNRNSTHRFQAKHVHGWTMDTVVHFRDGAEEEEKQQEKHDNTSKVQDQQQQDHEQQEEN